VFRSGQRGYFLRMKWNFDYGVGGQGIAHSIRSSDSCISTESAWGNKGVLSFECSNSFERFKNRNI
jgi:hypothetical protein